MLTVISRILVCGKVRQNAYGSAILLHFCLFVQKGVEGETETYLFVTRGVWKQGKDMVGRGRKGCDLTDMALFHTPSCLLKSTRR